MLNMVVSYCCNFRILALGMLVGSDVTHEFRGGRNSNSLDLLKLSEIHFQLV